MQHFGYLSCYRWKQDFTKPSLCQIRDNIWAIRGLLVIFFLAQNRSHYILPCLIFYGKFEVAEYWTRKRCNIVQLLKGKEVRMILLFWSIQSLFLRRPCLFDYAILIPYLLRVRAHNFSTWYIVGVRPLTYAAVSPQKLSRKSEKRT